MSAPSPSPPVRKEYREVQNIEEEVLVSIGQEVAKPDTDERRLSVHIIDSASHDLYLTPLEETDTSWRFWIILACVSVFVISTVRGTLGAIEEESFYSRVEVLTNMLNPIVTPNMLSDPTSPQFKALDWLANQDPAELDLTETPFSVCLERYVLAVLYFATDGPNWEDPYNFLSAASVCDWNSQMGGVSCRDSGKNVEEINMYDNNMQGTLPRELALLSHIHRLDIQSMSLVGPIPSEYGVMTSLVYFSLPNNQLVGSIPPELGELTKLGGVELWGNDLSGTIPHQLGGLEYLTSLSLSQNNKLSGNIPPELGSATDLGLIRLDRTQLTGNLDPVFCRGSETPFLFQADCGGPDPEVVCTCCSGCCDRNDACDFNDPN